MENAAPEKEFMNLAEIGARLGLSRQSAYRVVVQQQRIPHIRHGRNVRVPVAAWRLWLASQTQAAMAAMEDVCHE